MKPKLVDECSLMVDRGLDSAGEGCTTDGKADPRMGTGVLLGTVNRKAGVAKKQNAQNSNL